MAANDPAVLRLTYHTLLCGLALIIAACLVARFNEGGL